MPKTISQFMDKHFRHFNSASLLNASKSYKSLVENNGKMMVTLAGAISTAEIGKSLAEMIRNNKVHAICCTEANLEEDVFNLIAHNDYKMEPNYRELSAEQEMILHTQGYNRVTDTCIPEDTAVRRLSSLLLDEWIKLDLSQHSHAPHMFFWALFENKSIEKHYQIDPKDS
jgi:deoxyhypusine synthase